MQSKLGSPAFPANLITSARGLHLEFEYPCDLCTNPLPQLRIQWMHVQVAKIMSSCRKSKDRKRRQRKRGNERHNELKLAYDESKKALEREQRFKKALER